MDKKLHEDLNRIRKLSGLVEQDSRQEYDIQKPDGSIEHHTHEITTRRPGGYNGYNDIGDEGNGPSSGYGTGSGQYGAGSGSGTTGTGYGAGNNGTGFGQGNSQGLGSQGAGSGTGYGQIQRLPGSGAGSFPSVGGGSGTTIQRLPSGGTMTSTTTGGYPGEYSDSDYDEPVDPRQAARDRAAQRRQDAIDAAEQRRQDAEDAREAAAQARQDRLDAIAAQKAAKQAPQQQQQPLPSATTSLGKVPPKEPVKVEPPKEVPTLPSSTTSLGKAPPTSIAKDLLLKEPPKEVPVLPSATSSLGKLPTPAPKIEPPKQEPAKVEPPKEVPTLPSATTSLGKLPPKPMPKPPETTVVKHDEKPADDTITPSHPGITVNAPTDSKPVDTSTVGSGKTTPEATPAPPAAGPKIDLPVVDLTPTHPDRPTKPDSSTPDAVDLHMVQEPPSKEPGVAQQILLPKNEPTPPTNPTKPADQPANIELMPMSKDDADKVFGKMPNSSNPSPKPSAAGAGSGSPGDSASGASGTSGEKGGASSLGDPWARPLVLKPGETPRGKFDDPGRVGAPDFKGTLFNPGTLSNPVPGMPDTDLTGKVNSTPNPTLAGSGGKGVTLQPGDDPSDKSKIPDLVIPGPGNKSNEGMERILQLAGIKESTKVERQFLQESTVNKPNNIADTFKRLAGLK